MEEMPVNGRKINGKIDQKNIEKIVTPL